MQSDALRLGSTTVCAGSGLSSTAWVPAATGRAILLAWLLAPTASIAAPGLPSIVVLVVVDQLRRDRLDGVWTGGLGKLQLEGRAFINASVDHAVTTTCAGHVAVSTGMSPGRAGIPGNRYIDPGTWEEVSCVGDTDPGTRAFGSPSLLSPRAIRSETLGDWIKSAQPHGRVFAVAGKDRAAIPLAGHRADLAIWFDASQARFTTSRYYTDAYPQILKDFAASSPVNTRHLANLDKATFALAKQAIIEYQLGQDEYLDMLALGLSANDLAGHQYGPFSDEADEVLNQLDVELQAFLDFLDRQVGPDGYLLVLTSDHGALDVPETLRARGELTCAEASGRVDRERAGLRLYWHVYSRYTRPFGWPTKLVRVVGSRISINRNYARERSIDVASLVRDLDGRLESEPFIRHAWTHQEILEGQGAIAALYRNSLDLERSGDLLVQLEPTCLMGTGTGAGHGTPYSYDRDIPLIFYGPGIAPGRIGGEAHSTDVAPTLGALLTLPRSPGIDGRVLEME